MARVLRAPFLVFLLEEVLLRLREPILPAISLAGADPACHAPLGTSNNGLSSMEGGRIGGIVGVEVPEEHSVALASVHAKINVRESGITALVRGAEVHEHSRNAIARFALKTAMEVILVSLVLLANLVADEVEVLTVLPGQMGPVSNAAFNVLTKK